MNFKKIIASALSAAMVISSMALTAFADATLTLEASKSAVVRGDSFTVSLPIDAVKNVASADITLDYDENIFTCESGTTEFGDVVFNPVKDLGSGNLGAYFSINDIYAAKKSGKLFTATFKAKSDAVGGDYNFTVTVDSIKDVDGTAIDTYTVSPATVAVKAPEQLATPAVTIDRDTKKATWANVANAADYNVVLTKGTEELYNNNQGAAATGDNTFDFRNYVTETADYTVTVTANQNGSMYLASNAGTATENYVVDAEISITNKDYVLGSDGFALLYDEATGLYEINVKPVDGVRPAMSEKAAGKGIVIGKLIYKGGYGKGTIKAENIRLTVEKSDNTYKEIDATNAGFEFKYDIPEPSADLKVNVNLGRHYTKVDNAKTYQNMKLRVYSARHGFIDFDLGTRIRYLYIFEEHTPENSVIFLKKFLKRFPFEVECIQTDNGTEFTYKFISDETKCPFEAKLAKLGIEHRLIKPRTPWHNGKVERSHRMDQRYFYDWEYFRETEEANKKLAEHLKWTNNKPMRIFKGKSPMEKLTDYIGVI